ncbi:hypothetical protein [Sorangium sp. So ce385]|uniref:hypothetical protein n=1 Tax=Sorangium sp. So ce385 TaxID=3133308 RepID=UPI003F5C2EF4
MNSGQSTFTNPEALLVTTLLELTVTSTPPPPPPPPPLPPTPELDDELVFAPPSEIST